MTMALTAQQTNTVSRDSDPTLPRPTITPEHNRGSHSYNFPSLVEPVRSATATYIPRNSGFALRSLVPVRVDSAPLPPPHHLYAFAPAIWRKITTSTRRILATTALILSLLMTWWTYAGLQQAKRANDLAAEANLQAKLANLLAFRDDCRSQAESRESADEACNIALELAVTVEGIRRSSQSMMMDGHMPEPTINNLEDKIEAKELAARDARTATQHNAQVDRREKEDIRFQGDAVTMWPDHCEEVTCPDESQQCVCRSENKFISIDEADFVEECRRLLAIFKSSPEVTPYTMADGRCFDWGKNPQSSWEMFFCPKAPFRSIPKIHNEMDEVNVPPFTDPFLPSELDPGFSINPYRHIWNQTGRSIWKDGLNPWDLLLFLPTHLVPDLEGQPDLPGVCPRDMPFCRKNVIPEMAFEHMMLGNVRTWFLDERSWMDDHDLPGFAKIDGESSLKFLMTLEIGLLVWCVVSRVWRDSRWNKRDSDRKAK